MSWFDGFVKEETSSLPAVLFSGTGAVELRPVRQHRQTGEVPAFDGRLQEELSANGSQRGEGQHGTGEGGAAELAAGASWGV